MQTSASGAISDLTKVCLRQETTDRETAILREKIIIATSFLLQNMTFRDHCPTAGTLLILVKKSFTFAQTTATRIRFKPGWMA